MVLIRFLQIYLVLNRFSANCELTRYSVTSGKEMSVRDMSGICSLVLVELACRN